MTSFSKTFRAGFFVLACSLLGTAGASAQSLTALPASSALSSAGVGYGISLGNYDNDTDLDVFWGVRGGTNKVLRNDGSGGLTLGFTFPGSDATMGSATGDFDNDGWTDVVFGNAYLNNSNCNSGCENDAVYLNNQGANPTFSLAWTDGLGRASWHVAVGDFDNDGFDDFAAASASGGPSTIWINDSVTNGVFLGFTQATIPSGGPNTRGVAVGDVNGDIYPDVVFGDGTILISDGVGGFSRTAVASNGSAHYVGIGQMDGANGNDLVFSGDRAGQAQVFLKLNNAVYDNTGYSAQATAGNTTDVRFETALADITNDGVQDLVVVGFTFGPPFDSAFISDGSGGLTASGGLGWGGKGLAVGDMDGDGDDDVITADPNRVFRNDLAPFSTSIFVNTNADTAVAGDGVCSLREAMTNANLPGGGDGTAGDCAPGSVGLDTIEFAIPGLGSDDHSIALASALPSVIDQVVIDALTQGTATCGSDMSGRDLRVFLDGVATTAAKGIEILSGAGGSTIRGFGIANFDGAAVNILSSDSNLIECNNLGTNLAGTSVVGNGGAGLNVSGSSEGNQIGAASRGNLMTGNGANEMHFEPGADNNSIRANYFGTDIFGEVLAGRNTLAHSSNGASGNVYGGSGAGEGNLFRGSSFFAVEISRGDDNIFHGNSFVDNGRTLMASGAAANPALNNEFGGDLPGEGNTFTNNANAIQVYPNAFGTRIRRNSFVSNGIDIDLGADGVSANDAGDADAGPNNLQNYPVVLAAELLNGADLRVTYSIDTDVTSPIDVEFLVDGVFLDLGSYPSDAYQVAAAGNRTVVFRGAENLGASLGGLLRATATDSQGNTSEFSGPATIVAVPLVTDLGDDFDDGDLTTNTLGTGTGFASIGQGTATESAGTANFTSSGAATFAIESNDVFDPFAGDPTTVTWVIEDVGVTLPSFGNRTWVGIRPAGLPASGTESSFMPTYGGLSNGVYIAVNHNRDGRFPSSHGIVQARIGGNAYNLAQFEWSTYTGRTPLTVSLTTDGDAYSVAFSEAVTLSSGSLSGTIPGNPSSADYVAGVHYQGLGAAGTLKLDSATMVKAPSSPLVVSNANDAGLGSLRAAITYSNANPGAVDPNEITFDIDLGGASSAVIRPATALPSIRQPLIINGISQTGATCGTGIPDRVIKIVLDGSLMPHSSGGSNPEALLIAENTGNVTIQGLNINQFPGGGIRVLDGNSAVDIRCNYIGTDETGLQAFGNTYGGVQIEGYGTASTGNTIGGPNPEDGNLISANGGDEIHLEPGADSNTIQNNYVGTDKTGLVLLPSNIADPLANIGGIGSNQGGLNTITANIVGGFGSGITVGTLAASPGGNIVIGNYVGTDPTGIADLGNDSGVSLGGDADGTGQEQLGGTGAGEGNLIKNNGTGVLVNGASQHVIQNNQILGNGLGVKIENDLPNNTRIVGNTILDNGRGIEVVAADQIVIEGNTIGLSNSEGIVVTANADNITIQSNHIGMAADGETPAGNGDAGVRILGSADANILDNLISANVEAGIHLDNGTTGAAITGNTIGLTESGALIETLGVMESNLNGIIVSRSPNNVIGGTGAGEGNNISGNRGAGVIIEFLTATGNRVEGNTIGTTADGLTAQGNQDEGIRIWFGANNNVVGGSTGARNIISGNNGHGVGITEPSGDAPFQVNQFNTVSYNYIGLDQTGEASVANQGAGVRLDRGSAVNTVANNVISGNAGTGVSVTCDFKVNGIRVFPCVVNSDNSVTTPTQRNLIADNILGLSASQSIALGNSREGVSLLFTARDNTVTGNVISGNALDGVVMFRPGDDNVVKGNFIGTDDSGTNPFGNANNGIRIGQGGIGTLVGGTNPGDGNLIAHNGQNGVSVSVLDELGPLPSVAISGNAIRDNGFIGIDLDIDTDGNRFTFDGFTANDVGDFDVGPNGLKNFPVLEAANLVGTTLTVQYRLDAAVISDTNLEFFIADMSAQEGAIYLGSATILTGSVIPGQSATAELTVAGVSLGARVVATSTDADGNTSEFSPSVMVDDREFALPAGYVYQTIATTLASPQALALGNGDRVFVADQSEVISFDFEGAFTQSEFSGSFTSVAVDAAGNVFVVDGGSVRDGSGSAFPGAGSAARSVAIGPDQCLYVVGVNDLTRSCDAGGTFQVILAGGVDGNDIAWDGAGDAYVSRGNGDIIRVPAGATGVPADFPAVQSGLASPTAMAFSEDGRLFVSTAEGVLFGRPTELGLQRFSDFQGTGASDLVIGANSRLFVSHASRGRVYRFSIPAEQEVESTALQFYLTDSLRNMMPGVETAIMGAFAAWNAVGTADAANLVQYAGLAQPGENIAAVGDYRNLITADPSFPIGPQTLAVASKLLKVGATPEEAEILTADIIFNPAFDPANGNTPEIGSFGTDVQQGRHHIQGVAMHEIGHTMGLVHSGRPDATMFFILPPDARTLTLDDKAAISSRYPRGINPEGAFGAISGQVTSGNFDTFGRPVGAAMIIATEMSRVPRESYHAYTDRDGRYDLRFLEPGDYRIGLFALDGSVFAQQWNMTPGRISLQLRTIANETNFLEEYWNGTNESAVDSRGEFVTVTVGAGGSAPNINLITNLDTRPPSVTGITPDSGATAVSVRPQIRVLFSEGVEEGTPVATITPTGCAACTPVDLDVLLDQDGGRFAILSLPDLAADLSFLTSYDVVLTGAIDGVGNRQEQAFTSNFTTHAEDITAPTVVDISPVDQSGNVASSALVSVTFSESMDPASLINAQTGFRLMKNGTSPVAGTISLPSVAKDVVNTLLVFHPLTSLEEGAAYDVLLAGATDMSGIALSGATIYSFTAAAGSGAPPSTIDFGPTNGASDVSIETQVFADFSDAVDPGSVTPSSFAISRGGLPVDGTFAFLQGGRRVVFSPDAALVSSSMYTVTLTAGITDTTTTAPPVPLANPGSWTFTTGLEPFSVASLTPASAAVGGIVSIQGTGFSASGGDLITFTGTDGNPKTADVIRSTVSTLSVIVPFGAGTGPVNVNGQGALGFSLYVPPDVIEPALKLSGTDSGPRDVEVNPDGTIAVVANSGSNTVSLIEIGKDQQTSVSVGRTPMRVTITPDGTRAYVTNYNSHTVSVIDLACVLNGAAPVDGGTSCLRTIPVGYNPIGIDVSADGSLVYVAEYSSRSVSIIDAIPSSGTYNLAIRNLDTESATKEVAADPDGGVTILASESSPTTTDAVPDGGITLLASESNPRDVEGNPDGTGVWVSTNYGVLAFEVDLDRNQADWGVTMMVTESAAREAELDPDGALRLGATDSSNPDVNADPDGGTTRLGAESSVKDLEANPDGTLLFMTKGDGTLLVRGVPADPYALTDPYRAITKLGSESSSTEVALGPDGTLVYVTSYDRGTVSIYQFGSGFGSVSAVSNISYGFALIEVIRVGENPEGIAFSPAANFAAVTNSGSDQVTFMTFGAPIEVSDEPIALGDGDEVAVDVRLLVAETIQGLLEEATADAGSQNARSDDDDDDDDDDGDGDDDDDDDDGGGDDESEDVDDYQKALRYALKNLDSALWTDSTRTVPSEKKGKKVFNNDKQIVKALGRIIKRDGSGADMASLLIQNYLIPADRGIAQASIDQVQANFAIMEAEIDDLEASLSLPCGKKDKACKEAEKDLKDARKDLKKARKELDKSTRELEKAEKELAKGKWDKAIDKFKKAWEHAGRAEDDLAGKGNVETGTEVDELPIEFELSQNYPNPFNPVTTIEFAIPEMADVRLEVFDILGRRVQTLVTGSLDAGFHRVQFDASRLASGVYLYRIQAGAFSKVQRMVLMK